MRRSAAPSYRAAKRGKFVPPILGSQGSSENENYGDSKENRNSSSACRNPSNTQEKEIGLKIDHPPEAVPKDNNKEGITTINSQNRNNLQNESKTSINYPAKPRPQFRSPCLINKQSSTQSPVASTTNKEETTKCSYFSVVWCKMSKKKHKKWDGDGILMTRGRTTTLKDLEGKEIAKGSGYKTSELENLQEGQTLKVGGKEIEIMGSVSSEDFMTGKCFHDASSTTTTQDSGSRTSSHTKVLKPFNNPGRPSSSPSISASQQKVNEKPPILTPKHSPDAPGALVMPRPNTTHQWENNHAMQQIVDVVVDPHISQYLRPHQREGVVFLYECALGLKNFSGNGAVLGTLHKQNPYGSQPLCRKTLIITPGSLVKNWCSEFKKWLGNERIKVYPVTSEKRVKEFSVSPIYPVLIISYEMFIRSMDDIKDIKFDLLICDEAHRLKNSFIKTTTLISGLKTTRRILLTGTPIQNDLKEFHTLIELCNPGVLGTQVLFRRVYEQPIIQGQQPNATSEEKFLGQTRATELNRLTSLFFLRRTSEINNQYLPSKVETVVFCQPSQLQLSLYRRLLASRLVRSCFVGSCGGSRHLICIAALKKICNHPTLVYQASEDAATTETDDLDDEKSLYDGLISMFPQEFDKEALNLEMSGKLETLSKMLEDMFDSNQRVVVVSNYTQTLDVIQNLCAAREYRYLRLDGNTPTAKRQSLVERFNNKHSSDFVFLLSSKAGGVGLNLIGASKLILYDIDWNPANDLQAMARVWRDGQRKKVYIYRLLTTGTIEEKIYQRQTTKQSLSGAVADAKKEAKVEFTIEDIRDLFRLNENTFCATHDLLQCRCTDTQNGNEIEEDLQSTHASVTRRCQLGVPGISEKKQTSIAELMDWQHLQFPLDDADYEDESLRCARDTITFVFRSENTNSCQSNQSTE